MEIAFFLVGNRQEGAEIVGRVRAVFLAIGIGLASVLPGLGEESSVQRLEDAQRGMAEASWPRKPDNRMSPLSGKMKDMKEISPRFYGEEKEFRAKSAEGWQKEASLGRQAGWEGAEGRAWEKARCNQQRNWAQAGERNEKFQTQEGLAMGRTLAFREIEREPKSDWSSRSARLGGGREGALRMYEGRLTRVREQVWREEQSARDLGPGRQERFSPQEVETMLSQPVGEIRGAAKGQSPAASPLAAADN